MPLIPFENIGKLIKILVQSGQGGGEGETTMNHEQLTNLLGGSSSGHYHLTSDERSDIKKIIQAFISNDDESGSGGEVVIPDAGVSDHELLNGLLGGDAQGHYHLTAEEREKLINLSLSDITGAVGVKGDKGDKGDPGEAATIQIGTVTTGAAGTSATVSNSGTEQNAILNFVIPRGATGAQGPKGDTGDSSSSDIEFEYGTLEDADRQCDRQYFFIKNSSKYIFRIFWGKIFFDYTGVGSTFYNINHSSYFSAPPFITFFPLAAQGGNVYPSRYVDFSVVRYSTSYASDTDTLTATCRFTVHEEIPDAGLVSLSGGIKRIYFNYLIIGLGR